MTFRRLAIATAVALTLVTSAAAAPAIPHAFTAGTPAKAAEVNANFQALAQAIGALLPAGAIIPYAGDTAPDGFLLCNGEPKVRGEFPALFTAIGTKFGAGDGTNTFNLPDLRSRVIVGAGQGPALSSRGVAETGGAERHVLSTAELPSHAHGVSDPGHQHGHQFGFTGNNANMWHPSSGATVASGLDNPTVGTGAIQGATTGISVEPQGGGAAFGILPPFLVLNWIIKY